MRPFGHRSRTAHMGYDANDAADPVIGIGSRGGGG
jgi:hypothetical protein